MLMTSLGVFFLVVTALAAVAWLRNKPLDLDPAELALLLVFLTTLDSND
jgi:hypothetical protein